MVKVSIVVPVYNVEPYIEQCLNSIINQTLKDIEIIIVNDCSLANEEVIINKFLEKDNRIKYIKNEKNVGLGEARNIGFNVASGEYFGCVDSDDWIELDMYEKLYNQAKKLDADICWGQINFIDCIKNTITKTDFNYFSYINNTKTFSIKDLKKNDIFGISAAGWIRIYKKYFYKNNNFCYPKGVKYEDVILLYKGLLTSNKLSFIKDYVYNYRINRNGSINNSKPEINDIILYLNGVFNLFKEKKIFKEYKIELINFIITTYNWYPSSKELFNAYNKFIKEQNITKEEIKQVEKARLFLNCNYFFFNLLNSKFIKKIIKIFYRRNFNKGYTRILFFKIKNK